MERPASAQGGQGAHRRLSALGRGDRRGLSRPRVGQVPLRRQEPAHRPPDEPRRPRSPRRRSDVGGRRPDTGLVHPRRPQALPARRLLLDLRTGRRRGDRLAGRLPFPGLPRPVRGTRRPRPGPHRCQRPPSGRLGAHLRGRGLVPPLPGQGSVRAGRSPPADALGHRGLARHRRRGRTRPPAHQTRHPRPAGDSARRRRRLPRWPPRRTVAVDGQPAPRLDHPARRGRAATHLRTDRVRARPAAAAQRPGPAAARPGVHRRRGPRAGQRRTGCQGRARRGGRRLRLDRPRGRRGRHTAARPPLRRGRRRTRTGRGRLPRVALRTGRAARRGDGGGPLPLLRRHRRRVPALGPGLRRHPLALGRCPPGPLRHRTGRDGPRRNGPLHRIPRHRPQPPQKCTRHDPSHPHHQTEKSRR